jgi:hypothetical protein
VNEDTKKGESEVTPEGAVEVSEEDLDQASGGAAYLKMPTDQLKLSPAELKIGTQFGDGSVKPTGQDFTFKKI